jgi:mannan polymerase II complex ANP1 subunit
MGYSVIGLPHYVIWHLYEPSVDDIRHMEEMEKERLAREKQEEEKKKNQQKIKEEYSDTRNEWEKDKQEMQNLAAQPKPVVNNAPVAQPPKEQPPKEQPPKEQPAQQVNNVPGDAAQGETKPQVVKQEVKQAEEVAKDVPKAA